jgi:hypothetical protein
MITSICGKNCHLIAHGPSLSDHIDRIRKIDKKEELIISVNDIDIITDLYPDYWLFSNPDYSINKIYNRIGKYEKSVILFSYCYDDTNFDDINKLIPNKYYRYDSVHFNNEPNIWYAKGWRLGCQRGWVDCCSKIIENRLTLQETLEKYSGYNNHYSTGDSCIIHALAFSVIMGFDNIYVYGVDLDYTKGYYNGYLTSGSGGAVHGDSFDYWMDRIKSDFYIISQSAKLKNININYLGYNKEIGDILNNNKIPTKVYDRNCKNYD